MRFERGVKVGGSLAWRGRCELGQLALRKNKLAGSGDRRSYDVRAETVLGVPLRRAFGLIRFLARLRHSLFTWEHYEIPGDYFFDFVGGGSGGGCALGA